MFTMVYLLFFVFCDNMNLFMVTLEPSPFLCVAAISTSKEMSARHQNGHYISLSCHSIPSIRPPDDFREQSRALSSELEVMHNL